MFKFLISSFLFLTLGISSARAELQNTCYPFLNRFFDEANKYIYQAENWVNKEADNYVNMLDFTLGTNQFGVVGDASLGRLKSPPVSCTQIKTAYQGGDPKFLPNGMQDIGFDPKYSVMVKIFSKPVEVVRVMMEASQKGSPKGGKVKFGVYLLGMKINQKTKEGPATKPVPVDNSNPNFGQQANAALDKPAQDTKGSAGKILDINRAIFENPMTRPQIPIIPGILQVEFNAGVVFQINLAISYGVNSDLLSALGMNFSKTWQPGMNGEEIKECDSETSCQTKISKPQEKDSSFWAKIGQATGVSDVSQQFNNLKKDYYALREKNLRKDVQLFKSALGEEYEKFKNAQSNEEKGKVLENIDLEVAMRPLDGYSDIAQGTMDHASGLMSSATKVIEQAEQFKKMFAGGGIPAVEAYVNLGVSARATVWATAVLSLGIPMAKAYAGLKGVLNIIDANAGVAAKIKTTSQYLDLEANVQWVLMSGLLQLIYGVEVDLGFYKDNWEGSKDLVTFPGFPFKWKTLLGRIDFRPQNLSPLAWCWDPTTSQYMDKRCYDGDQSMDDQLAAMSAHAEFSEKFFGETLPNLNGASAFVVDSGTSLLPLSGPSLSTEDYEKIYLLKPDFFMSSLLTGMGKVNGNYTLNLRRPLHIMDENGGQELPVLTKSFQVNRTLNSNGIWDFTFDQEQLIPNSPNQPYMSIALNYEDNATNLIDLGLVSNSPICGASSQATSRSSGSGLDCSSMDGLVKLKDLLLLSNNELGCLAKDSRLGLCQIALDNGLPQVYIGASKFQGQDLSDIQDKSSSCNSSSVTNPPDILGCHLRKALLQGACFPAFRLAQFMAIARQSDDDILAMFNAQGSDKKISGQHALTTPTADWTSYVSIIHNQDDYHEKCHNFQPYDFPERTRRVKLKFFNLTPALLNIYFWNASVSNTDENNNQTPSFGMQPPSNQIQSYDPGFVQFLVQVWNWQGDPKCEDSWSSWGRYQAKYAYHAVFSSAKIQHAVKSPTSSTNYYPSIPTCRSTQSLDALNVKTYLYANLSRHESHLKQAIINKAQADANSAFGTNYSPTGDFLSLTSMPNNSRETFIAGIKQCLNAGDCKIATTSTELDQSSLASSGDCKLFIDYNNSSLGSGTDINQCAALVGDIDLLCNSKRSLFTGNSGPFSVDVSVEFRRGSDPVERMVVGKCSGNVNSTNRAVSVSGNRVDSPSSSSSKCQIKASGGGESRVVDTSYNFDYPTDADGCLNQIPTDLFNDNICKNVPGSVLAASQLMALNYSGQTSTGFGVNITSQLGGLTSTQSKTCQFTSSDPDVSAKINHEKCSIKFTETVNGINTVNEFRPAGSLSCDDTLSRYITITQGGSYLNCNSLAQMNEFRATLITGSSLSVSINRPGKNSIVGNCLRPAPDNFSSSCRFRPMIELSQNGFRQVISFSGDLNADQNNAYRVKNSSYSPEPTSAQACVDLIKYSEDINPIPFLTPLNCSWDGITPGNTSPCRTADVFCLSFLNRIPSQTWDSFIPNWQSGGYRGAISPLSSNQKLRITPDAFYAGNAYPTGVGCDLALVKSQKPDNLGGTNYKWDIALASMAPFLNDQRNDANNVEGSSCLRVKTSVARDSLESPLQGPWCGVVRDNPVANLSQAMLNQLPSTSTTSYALASNTCFTYKCAEFSEGEKLIFAGTGPQLLRIKGSNENVSQSTICGEIGNEISPLSDLDKLPANLPPEAKRRPVWIYSATRPNETINLNQLKNSPPAFGCGVDTCGIKVAVGSISDLAQTYGQTFEDQLSHLLYDDRELSFSNAQSCFDYHLGKKNPDGSLATLGSLSSICSIVQGLDYVPDNLPIEVSVAYGSMKKPLGSCPPSIGNQKTCEVGYNTGGMFSSFVLLDNLSLGLIPISTSLPGASTIWVNDENTLDRCIERAMSSIDCSKIPQENFGSTGEAEIITRFGQSEVSLGQLCLVKPGQPEFNEVDKDSCSHYLRMPEPSPQSASYFVEICLIDNCTEANFVSGHSKIVPPGQAVEFSLPLMLGNDSQIRAFLGKQLAQGAKSLKSRVRSFNNIATSGWSYFNLPILSEDNTIKASCLKRWSDGAPVVPDAKDGFVKVEPSKEFCGAIITLPKKIEDPDSIVVLNDDYATIMMCLEKECNDDQVIWKFESSRIEPNKLNFLEFIEKNGGKEKLVESLNKGNQTVFGKINLDEKEQVFEIPVFSLDDEMSKKCKESWGVKMLDEKDVTDSAQSKKEILMKNKTEMILEENSAILEE